VIFCVKCCAVIRGERSPISSRSECCWASINCRLDLDALWETLPVFSDVPTRAFSLACTRRGGELIPSCLCAVQRFFLQLTISETSESHRRAWNLLVATREREGKYREGERESRREQKMRHDRSMRASRIRFPLRFRTVEYLYRSTC